MYGSVMCLSKAVSKLR